MIGNRCKARTLCIEHVGSSIRGLVVVCIELYTDPKFRRAHGSRRSSADRREGLFAMPTVLDHGRCGAKVGRQRRQVWALKGVSGRRSEIPHWAGPTSATLLPVGWFKAQAYKIT